MKILLSLLLGSILIASPSYADAPIKPKMTDTDEIITYYAKQYKVSEKVMHTVVKCESSYKETAIGDGGKSFGLVQIHLPSHPNITKEQAYDKEFAIEFLAKNLSQKKGRLWTCWRTHFA